MESKNIILAVIAVLVIALIAVGAYVMTNNSHADHNNVTANVTNHTSNNTVSHDIKNNTTNNTKVVGDNSPREKIVNNSNNTFKVYVPQSDSYVEVIGEKYDAEVNRWYTYDKDGVRYYNTRIN